MHRPAWFLHGPHNFAWTPQLRMDPMAMCVFCFSRSRSCQFPAVVACRQSCLMRLHSAALPWRACGRSCTKRDEEGWTGVTEGGGGWRAGCCCRRLRQLRMRVGLGCLVYCCNAASSPTFASHLRVAAWLAACQCALNPKQHDI